MVGCARAVMCCRYQRMCTRVLAILALLLALASADLGAPALAGAAPSLEEGPLAPRLRHHREQLSLRHLAAARQGADGHATDGVLAWRHLEASHVLDPAGNTAARAAVLGHHLDAALQHWEALSPAEAAAAAAGESLPFGRRVWQLDHELGAAYAAAAHSGASPTAVELEDLGTLNDLARQAGHRQRMRRERQQNRARASSSGDGGGGGGGGGWSGTTRWRALFASMVLQRRCLSDESGWSNAALVAAALDGLRLSRLPGGHTRTQYAAGTAEATVENNEFFAWQMDVLRKTGAGWSGLEALPGWDRLVLQMRAAAHDFLVGHGVPLAEARRRCATAPLVSWASVHRLGGEHPTHIHDDATVSGVYYAQVPPGAGGASTARSNPCSSCRALHDLITLTPIDLPCTQGWSSRTHAGW